MGWTISGLSTMPGWYKACGIGKSEPHINPYSSHGTHNFSNKMIQIHSKAVFTIISPTICFI